MANDKKSGGKAAGDKKGGKGGDKKGAAKGGAGASATPPRITLMQRICSHESCVPSQTRSMTTAKGAARHCVNNIAKREPSRGKA